MTYDSDEKLEKFMRVINAEMDERKRLFAHESAQSFAMYNEVAEKKLPALIIAVDNFDVLKEIGLETDVFFARVTRDGPGIGIYVITSANTSSSIRYNIMAGFKNKASFFQYDDGELRNLIGRSEYRLPEVRGRALVNYEGGNVMQAYLPAVAETEREYVGKLNALIDSISGRYEGQAAKSGVAMLPDKVTMADLSPETAPSGMIPIGLDAETVTPAYLDMKEGLHLIVGKPKSGKSNVLKIILSGIKEGRKFVCDTSALELRDYAKDDRSLYIYGEDGRDEFFEKLKETVEAREAAFKENGGDMLPREYYRTLEPVSLVIDDAENFIKVFSAIEADMGGVLKRLITTGGSLFVSVLNTGIKTYGGTIPDIFREGQRGVVLGSPNEQNIFQMQAGLSRVRGDVKIGYICGYGEPVKVKTPKM
jgi:S-DNA-T family DNA segregation ATPase FtsK/SpoIIIE